MAPHDRRTIRRRRQDRLRSRFRRRTAARGCATAAIVAPATDAAVAAVAAAPGAAWAVGGLLEEGSRGVCSVWRDESGGSLPSTGPLQSPFLSQWLQNGPYSTRHGAGLWYWTCLCVVRSGVVSVGRRPLPPGPLCYVMF